MPRPRTSNLMKRESTLRYEIAKDLTPEARQLTPEETQLRAEILALDGKCEYCRIREASRSKGDHFYSIICKKYPSVYCSDDWNIIPACSTCNSSKNGKTWKEWFESNNASNPYRIASLEEQANLMDKFTRYDEAMQRYCQRKDVDRLFFDDCMKKVTAALRAIDDDILNYNTQQTRR